MIMKGDCLDYYIIMCQQYVTSGSMAHTHTTLGWPRNKISLKYSNMLCHVGVGLNQKQYIIKGMTCGMGLHLVIYKTVGCRQPFWPQIMSHFQTVSLLSCLLGVIVQGQRHEERRLSLPDWSHFISWWLAQNERLTVCNDTSEVCTDLKYN